MADFPPNKFGDEAGELSQHALDRLRDVLKGTDQRRQLSELTGIPAPTLKDYFTGRSSPPLDRFLLIASAAGLRPEAFFSTAGTSYAAPKIADTLSEIVMIPVLNVQASAGPGHVADIVRAEAEFPFPLHFLRKLLGDRAYSAKLESLRAKGESMAPTIHDGALIVIDRSQRELPQPPAKDRARIRQDKNADIFVFYQGDNVRLKRIIRINREHIAILSDNHGECPTEVYKLGEDGSFNIIGKVIWWDNRL